MSGRRVADVRKCFAQCERSPTVGKSHRRGSVKWQNDYNTCISHCPAYKPVVKRTKKRKVAVPVSPQYAIYESPVMHPVQYEKYSPSYARMEYSSPELLFDSATGMARATYDMLTPEKYSGSRKRKRVSRQKCVTTAVRNKPKCVCRKKAPKAQSSGRIRYVNPTKKTSRSKRKVPASRQIGKRSRSSSPNIVYYRW